VKANETGTRRPEEEEESVTANHSFTYINSELKSTKRRVTSWRRKEKEWRERKESSSCCFAAAAVCASVFF
jgi:hypothetical protein